MTHQQSCTPDVAAADLLTKPTPADPWHSLMPAEKHARREAFHESVSKPATLARSETIAKFNAVFHGEGPADAAPTDAAE